MQKCKLNIQTWHTTPRLCFIYQVLNCCQIAFLH